MYSQTESHDSWTDYEQEFVDYNLEYNNREWKKLSIENFFSFGGELTFNSRWLYPFAKSIISQPNNVGKFIFLSDPSWFQLTLSSVTIVDCMRLASNPSNFHGLDAGSKRIRFPQNLNYMCRSLDVKDRKLNKQLFKVLWKLFRSTSKISNFRSKRDERSELVPYTNLDIFVKVDTIPRHPNLVKVCLGGFPRYNSLEMARLAIKLKTYGNPEFKFPNDLTTNFYKSLYIDRLKIFDTKEIPLSTMGKYELPKPILTGYVDLNREKFLQETFLGKLMFFWYSRSMRKDRNNLYPRYDLPELEIAMASRFPELMNTLIRKEIPREPILY